MTREALGLWSAHIAMAVLTLLVAHDLLVIWQPVLGSAT